MTVINTESVTNSSTETRSGLFCREWPQFIWDINHKTSFKIIVAITTIACPVTILLNLLVIIAVKTRRELKKNSNILLSSVALADLLVGAVSMPLSITLDALVIQPVLVADVICKMPFISASVLYTLCGASFFHLLLIAWERYVAIAKWTEYKAIVTTGRVNKYKRVAWLLTVLMVVPLVVMEAISVRYEIKLVVNVISSIFLFVCISVMAYFYVKAYLAIGNWNRTRIRPVNVLVKGKLESKVARTTFWFTVFFAVSTLPISFVYLFQGALPFFRQISTMRWAETILQLNSLFNPLLYWYRNRRLRKATLELLMCRNTPEPRTARRIRQRRNSVASLDVEKLQNEQRGARLLRSQSVGAIMCLETFRQRRIEAVKERPMSAPSGVESDQIFTQQRNQLTVTVQIENTPVGEGIQRKTGLLKNTTELGRSRPHIGSKIVRSTLKENSVVPLTKCHQNPTKRNTQRSRSVPIELTNLNEPNYRITVDKLTDEKKLS